MANGASQFAVALLGAALMATTPGCGQLAGGKFDYATASLEDKQRYLEAKAKNFSRGFNLTKGGASEITSTYIDAATDLVSITMQLKDPKLEHAPVGNLGPIRDTILKTACTLTERNLLAETDFNMRLRFWKPGGAKLMTVEVNGESCAPYMA